MQCALLQQVLKWSMSQSTALAAASAGLSSHCTVQDVFDTTTAHIQTLGDCAPCKDVWKLHMHSALVKLLQWTNAK